LTSIITGVNDFILQQKHRKPDLLTCISALCGEAARVAGFEHVMTADRRFKNM